MAKLSHNLQCNCIRIWLFLFNFCHMYNTYQSYYIQFIWFVEYSLLHQSNAIFYFIEVIFVCSSFSILCDHRIWCVQFYSVSKKMAKTNAALGVRRINPASIHNEQRKATAPPKNSSNIDHSFVCRFGYIATYKIKSLRVPKSPIAIFVIYTVEHVFNMISIMVGAIKAEPPRNPLQELFEVQVPFLFTIIELSWWKAILSKWFNIVVTFVWSFMDLFVMIVSVGLASQFKQLNTDMKRTKGQVKY